MTKSKSPIYYENPFDLMKKVKSKSVNRILVARALGEPTTHTYYVIEISDCDLVETDDSYFYMIEVLPKYRHRRGHYNYELEKLNYSSSEVKNRFTCVVDKASESVKFGPDLNLGMLSEELKGIGLGSYCFGRLVKKLVDANLGKYKVSDITLVKNDASNNEARLRRNHFYANRGFKFGNTEHKHETKVQCTTNGSCFAASVDSLNSTYNEDKVAEISDASFDLLSDFYNEETEFG